MKVNRRQLLPGERIRVLVVDDSVVIRRLVTQALSQHPSIEIVGSAANGTIALQRLAHFNPDVVTLDIEMPDMDGLEVLRHIRRDAPSTRVIMFSTLTERGAEITFEALALGADDYVTKASGDVSGESPISRIQQALVPKITQFFLLPGQSSGASSPSPAAAVTRPATQLRGLSSQPRLVAIGVSTGGPTALSSILPQFPADFGLPILVVQHMPPLFTRLLAERLNSGCALHVEEATQGRIVKRGEILVAPGDYHMKVARQDERVSVSLDQSAHQNFCRPAVDVLFRSAAETYGGSVIAVVLTGMGQDGMRGAETLKAQGASILVQDEATSVVWGMPGAVANSGLADRILPLREVVPEILKLAGRN